MAEKVVLGLSGGMDSSFAAMRLMTEGYEVIGANIVMRGDIDASAKALALAERLGIEFHVIHAEEEFERSVIRPFAEMYATGLTPNPCALCNPTVKFKQLFALAECVGASAVATGHYSVPVRCDNGRYSFAPAADIRKDQGYFLYALPQEMIARLVFPLGNVLKSDIKAFFGNTDDYKMVGSAESNDICFVPQGKYTSVVERYTAVPPTGDFVDEYGKVLGRHNGIHNYTLGQRKGLGIALGIPAYVSDIDPIANTVTLSFGAGAVSSGFAVSNINMLSRNTVSEGDRFTVRTRYRSAPMPCIVVCKHGEGLEIAFDGGGAVAAPGQSAVFYDGNGCIAFGGTVVR